MAADQLTFQGINRAVSDYAASGACEELINLRPTTAGLVPVKPFSVKMSDVSFDKVYVHYAQGATNYIGVTTEEGALVGYLLDEHGAAVGEAIFRVEGGDSLPQITGFATTGNMALFSFEDKDDGIYATRALLWNGSEYEEMEADVPDITTSFAITDTAIKQYDGQAFTTSNTQKEIADIISSGLNALQEENKSYCFGPFIVAIAFKTNDAKTFWTGKWFTVNPVPTVNASSLSPVGSYPFHQDANGYYATYFPEVFAKYSDAYFFAGNIGRVAMIGSQIEMTLSQISGWNEDTSVIRSVEIYASRPALYVDPVNFYGGTKAADGLSRTLLPQVPYTEMKLGDQLLYLQKSISLKDLSAADQSFTMEFGGNIQTTNTTLEVDAGMVTRYGKILAYNNRFHYYDSLTRTLIGKPDFAASIAPSKTGWSTFVIYNDGQKDHTAYVGVVDVPNDGCIVTAPSLKVKEVLLLTTSGGSFLLRKYAMTESSRYNYSYNDSGPYLSQTYSTQTSEIRDLLRIQVRGEQSSFLTDEPDAMNVTEQYNPFVFRVEHSYLAPGRILDVQPQMVAVSDVSYGDYPLNIFTSRGVYALLQGSGTILYGNLRPISNLVSEKNCVPTESGTFFIAAGGLWLIFGNRAVLISDALHLGPHKYIRTSAGHIAIAYDKYGLRNYESAVSFELFTNGAALAYNRYRDELIISNHSYSYSYVLSLKYRQWYKIAQSLSQDVVGSNIARQGDTIYDFSDEREKTTILVHLQSRPFSFAYQYSHIHRIVAMIRATLSSQVDLQALTVALYGSDDLQHWKLLSYANRHNTSFSQIRTAPAARSWRYYTITISGNVPEDTDFGPVLVDYEPVIRRIG